VLFQQDEVKCPEDNESISANSPDSLPKNFALLKLVQRQRGTNDPTMCKEHRRKLEYVCMEEKIPVCANCALVGSHRGHEVKQKEEVLQEIGIRAECLLDMLQIIERSQSFALDEPIKAKLDSLHDVYLDKKNNLTRELETKFSELHRRLNEMQETATKTLENCLHEIESNFVNIRDMPRLIDAQASSWMQSAKEKLQNIGTRSDDPTYIAFEMLEANANELLEQGEKILMELEGMKDLPIKPLEQIVSDLSIKFHEFPEVCSISFVQGTGPSDSSINEDKFEFALDAVRHHTLEEADFSTVGSKHYADLGDLGAKIAPFLVDNSCLKTLRLTGCNLSDSAAIQIFLALQENNTLKSLDISSNALGEKALEELVELLEVNTTLRELSIKDHPSMSEDWKEKLLGLANKFRRVSV
jgi:hypothetical protein